MGTYALKLYIVLKHSSCAVCTVPFSKIILSSLYFGVLQYIVGEGAKGDFFNFVSHPNCKDEDTKKISKIPKRYMNWTTLGMNSIKEI